MLTTSALAATSTPIRHEDVERDARIVTEFLDYIRWLADQDTGLRVTIGQLWELYHLSVQHCQMWSATCEDLGLPVRDDWLD